MATSFVLKEKQNLNSPSVRKVVGAWFDQSGLLKPEAQAKETVGGPSLALQASIRGVVGNMA